MTWGSRVWIQAEANEGCRETTGASRTVATIYAITVDTARNVALGVALGALVLAVLSAIALKAIVSKLIAVGLLLVIAVAVWTQRASLEDCADRLPDDLAAGSTDDTTCSFFGRDITVPSPR